MEETPTIGQIIQSKTVGANVLGTIGLPPLIQWAAKAFLHQDMPLEAAGGVALIIVAVANIVLRIFYTGGPVSAKGKADST